MKCKYIKQIQRSDYCVKKKNSTLLFMPSFSFLTPSFLLYCSQSGLFPFYMLDMRSCLRGISWLNWRLKWCWPVRVSSSKCPDISKEDAKHFIVLVPLVFLFFLFCFSLLVRILFATAWSECHFIKNLIYHTMSFNLHTANAATFFLLENLFSSWCCKNLNFATPKKCVNQKKEKNVADQSQPKVY